MRRFKTLLFVTVMALAVMTWAGWSPASAYTESDHTAVEETMGQEDEAIEEDGAIEEEDNGAMEGVITSYSIHYTKLYDT